MNNSETMLTDEAREVVERLRKVDVSDIDARCADYDIRNKIMIALEIKPKSYGELCRDICDRICDLIEHGTKPDPEREAAADWVEAQGGLDAAMDYPEMDGFVARLATDLDISDEVGDGDELREAIKAELDKRLMPPDLEWPSDKDGKRIEFGEKFIDGGGDEHEFHGLELWDKAGAGLGAQVIMRGRTSSKYDSIALNVWPGHHVKRPQIEVLGSDWEVEVEDVPEPDPEREAAADWVNAHGGLGNVQMIVQWVEDNGPSITELDKRLMPEGMEWPQWDDNLPLTQDDCADGVFAVALGLNGGYALLNSLPVFDGAHCLMLAEAGERIERPKPEVLGADGLPIREGETVWDITSPNDATAITVWQHGGPLEVVGYNQERPGYVICKNDQMLLVDCLVDQLTHTPPDTQERINGGKRTAMLDYWGCRGLSCGECPAKIDGLMPKQRYGTYDCIVAQGMDIARREQELRARTAGDA